MCLTVFEQVDQSDYVVMLAHFEDLDLPALLEHLYRLHVLLLHRLDGNLLLRVLVLGQFDEAKLTLAQLLSQVVVIEQVGEAHGLQQHG